MFDGSPIRTIAQFGPVECATCVGPRVYTWRTRAVVVFIGRVNSRFMQPVSILARHLSPTDPIVSLCVRDTPDTVENVIILCANVPAPSSGSMGSEAGRRMLEILAKCVLRQPNDASVK